MAELSYTFENALFEDFISGKTFVMRLYKNERTPSKTDVISNFTELDEAGYASINIVEGDWTIGIVSGVTTLSVSKTFVITGEVPIIYGFYITNSLNTIYYHGEVLDDAPISIGLVGEEITINCNIQFNG